MAFGARKIQQGIVEPGHFHSTRYRRFIRDYFGVQPICTASVGYGNPTGSTGDVNVLMTPVALYEYHIKGAGQTIVAPVWSASGLDIGLDATNDEGIEITNGITALSNSAFVIGTDRKFYARCQITMADVSVTDALYFGFRKTQAYQTAVASTYTDYACLGINASAATAAIKILTDVNNAGEAEVDTTDTWADGATKTFEVQVDEAGYARFLLNSAQPTVTYTGFQFDSGDTVIPFLFHLRASTAANAVNLKLWEVGYVPKRGE
jgi:hypothetical protein